MPRLFGCKYNAEVSYIGSIQESSRDSVFQTIYPCDEVHMTPAQALEQDKMKACIRLLPL